MMNSAHVQEKMRKECQDIISMKRNFQKGQINIDRGEHIKAMRLCHARAIISLEEYTKHVCINKTTDDLLALSICTSLLYVIHLNVRQCEKLVYGDSFFNDSSSVGQIISNEDIPTPDLSTMNKNKNKINITKHMTQNGTEELNFHGLITSEQSALPPSNNSAPLPPSTNSCTSSDSKQNGLNTEFINDMQTSDVKSFLTDGAVHKQTGGDDPVLGFSTIKPTLINYWANWCGFCKKFNPEWEKFKLEAKAKFPQLQICDLDVGRDADLDKLAKRVGVRGYPTIVLFANNKITMMVSGNKTKDDICKFVTDNFNKV